MMIIHGIEVEGLQVDPQSRCIHYSGPNDIVAIKFKCCGRWFSCHQCHTLARHEPEVWPQSEFDQPALLCGGCGHQLTIREYLACNSVCPACSRSFNPRCLNHWHRYFEAA